MDVSLVIFIYTVTMEIVFASAMILSNLGSTCWQHFPFEINITSKHWCYQELNKDWGKLYFFQEYHLMYSICYYIEFWTLISKPWGFQAKWYNGKVFALSSGECEFRFQTLKLFGTEGWCYSFPINQRDINQSWEFMSSCMLYLLGPQSNPPLASPRPGLLKNKSRPCVQEDQVKLETENHQILFKVMPLS